MNPTPAARQAPDVRQLRDRELPALPFPGGRGLDFRIYLTPEVYEALAAHAAENTTVEICGVLVGTWASDPGGAFLHVTDAIRGEAARNKFAEVTFTHETWARINDEMDKRFADRSIVGWYHTHPDFGVFLSDRDRFIQEHFFAGDGQIALVIDPIRRTVGAFAWRDGKPTLCPHFWVGDRVVPGTAAGQEDPTPAARTAAAPAPPAGAAAAQPSRSSPLTQPLAYLALFLLGYLLSGFRSAWEQARLVEGVVAHYGLWQGLRPGLHEGLDLVSDQLAALSQRLDGLSADHLNRVGNQKGAQDQARLWAQTRGDLAKTTTLVNELDRAYSLTPEEAVVVQRLMLERLRDLSEPRPAAGPARPPAGAAAGSPKAGAGSKPGAGTGGSQPAPASKPAAPQPAAPATKLAEPATKPAEPQPSPSAAKPAEPPPN